MLHFSTLLNLLPAHLYGKNSNSWEFVPFLKNNIKKGGVLHFLYIVYVENEEGDKNPEKFIYGHSSVPKT